jgi:cytochrome c peroxidase
MRKNVLTLTALVMVGALHSCLPYDNVKTSAAALRLPAVPYSYDSAANNYIPTLGRVLFYDPRLSINSSISCASCHKQARAFADNVSFSSGFEGRPTFRNSMPIQNEGPVMSFAADFATAFALDTPSLFWDGREKLLKAMVLRPITNHVEMGITDIGALALKLSAIGDYQDLFTKAYGTPEVTEMKIADALSRFVINIRSTQTAFDASGEGTTNFSDVERNGWKLFSETYNCNSCHQVVMPNGYRQGGGFVNIGLDINYKDVGFADVSGLSTDIGKFKIPTLRNVGLTAPYMHDGRFATLNDVLEHYSSGIQDHPNLDPRLRDARGRPLKMNIAEQDRTALIAFLNTLTDYSMITDPRFSNPFVTP